MPQPEDPRGGAAHAEEFYNTWDFAKTAVSLYCAGVSWKGLSVYGATEESDSTLIGEIAEETLREALPEWFVRGRTCLTVDMQPEFRARVGQQPDGQVITLLTAATGPDYQQGYTLLWPACSNHPALLEFRGLIDNSGAEQVLGLLMRFAYQGLSLPNWALDPVQARTASADMVTMGLHFYRLRVDQWRETIGFQLTEDIRRIVTDADDKWKDVWLSWNQEWSPSNSYGGWEPLYEAFASCEIRLETFAAEHVGGLRKLTDAGLLPRSVLAGWQRLGF